MSILFGLIIFYNQDQKVNKKEESSIKVSEICRDRIRMNLKSNSRLGERGWRY